jgi:hypothetical protein
MAKSPDALRRARAALDDLAAAMVAGRADAVLTCEAQVSDAARHLSDAAASENVVTSVDRAEVVAACLAVRAALLRCQMLGNASATLERVVVPTPAYDGPVGRTPRQGRLATRESRM